MATKKKTQSSAAPTEVMVVNDVPGEECRVAILHDGHLEELYAERTGSATNVGNIYKGRVTNVESAIQAAFVDYGEGQSGFLHISDLHPRYFPGDDRTERVGKKIPRRERPPMQKALRRGDEILVQVLKQGIGTKGPTLTSYLSIPGRLLVMMPEMDRVGVSRKVEDETRRREMRKILDTLDLPDGCGFIMRTAGFGATKTELKRDVAYLTRLWKVMDQRIKTVGAPCELYTESDLLIRTIRDVLRPSIKAIVVDSESAYERVSMFLRVIAPRSAPRVVNYRRTSPVFHAYDVERQIELIHAREVPLPSGGAIVIDQTEALVAIDVNSGKSRSASDSETNAYRTNCEAVDEIARQLRLRDLGGLVVNDLIDMRSHKNRRQIEERFKNLLKTDRARTTVARISEFGIVEMTRQRMRPSLRKSSFVACPHCAGQDEVRSPEYQGSYATRHIGFLLQYERIARVEVVCSPHVASYMLSQRRRQLVELEDVTGKRIDVRVSDAIAADRVDFYGYDARDADVDLEKLPRSKQPTLDELDADPDITAAGDGERAGGRKRRRRRRRTPAPADATAIALAGGFEDIEEEEGDDVVVADALAEAEAEAEGEERPGRRRRRRGRRGRGGEKQEQEAAREAVAAEVAEAAASEDIGPIRVHLLAKELGVTSRELIERCAGEGIEIKNHMSSVKGEVVVQIRGWYAPEPAPTPAPTEAPTESEGADDESGDGTGRRRRRRRRGGRGRGRGRKSEAATTGESPMEADDAVDAEASDDDAAPRGRRSRRGGRGRRGRGQTDGVQPEAAEGGAGDDSAESADRAPAKKKTRRVTKADIEAGVDVSSDDEAPRKKSTRKATTKKKTKTTRKKKSTDAVAASDDAEPVVTATKRKKRTKTVAAAAADAPPDGTATATLEPVGKPKGRRLYRSRTSVARGMRDASGDDA